MDKEEYSLSVDSANAENTDGYNTKYTTTFADKWGNKTNLVINNNNTQDEKITLEYKNKIIFDKKLNAPEVFKLTVDENEIVDIKLIEFEDIKYKKGV